MSAILDMDDTVLVKWPYKLLSPGYHRRLVDDLEGIAHRAGVPVAMLDRSMAEFCSPEEIEWVQHYRNHHGKYPGGLILEGSFDPAPITRMQAMAAAFLRNYLDARLVTLFRLLPDESGENDIDARIVLVPDFYIQSTTGSATLANWQFQYLHGALLERFSARRSTVLYVESMAGLRKTYGKNFHDFLFANWKVLESK